MSRAPGVSAQVNANAKLTDAQVLELRSRREPLRNLSIRWGVSEMNLWRARAGRTYRHVPMPDDE